MMFTRIFLLSEMISIPFPANFFYRRLVSCWVILLSFTTSKEDRYHQWTTSCKAVVFQWTLKCQIQTVFFCMIFSQNMLNVIGVTDFASKKRSADAAVSEWVDHLVLMTYRNRLLVGFEVSGLGAAQWCISGCFVGLIKMSSFEAVATTRRTAHLFCGLLWRSNFARSQPAIGASTDSSHQVPWITFLIVSILFYANFACILFFISWMPGDCLPSDGWQRRWSFACSAKLMTEGAKWHCVQ